MYWKRRCRRRETLPASTAVWRGKPTSIRSNGKSITEEHRTDLPIRFSFPVLPFQNEIGQHSHQSRVFLCGKNGWTWTDWFRGGAAAFGEYFNGQQSDDGTCAVWPIVDSKCKNSKCENSDSVSDFTEMAPIDWPEVYVENAQTGNPHVCDRHRCGRCANCQRNGKESRSIIHFNRSIDLLSTIFQRNSTSAATRNMLIPQQGIHIELNRNEQHIQIGDAASDSDRFTVEIYWQQCRWLSYVSVIEAIRSVHRNVTA